MERVTLNASFIAMPICNANNMQAYFYSPHLSVTSTLGLKDLLTVFKLLSSSLQ